MRQFSNVLPLLLSAILLASCGAGGEQSRREISYSVRVHRHFLDDISRFESSLADLDSGLAALRSQRIDTTGVREKFRVARRTYKSLEHLAEYYAPSTAAGLNGPPLFEVEEDDPNQIAVQPEGLQVIEALLYEEPMADIDSISLQLAVTRANAKRLRLVAESTEFTDENIFEAMRLELARVVSLGIAGFDTPLSCNAVVESAAALEGIRQIVMIYGEGSPERRNAVHALDSLLAEAIRRLNNGQDCESFDHAGFIRGHAQPVAHALASFRKELRIVLPDASRPPFRAGMASIFDSSAFDPQAFAPPYALDVNGDRVELGRLLFFDPLLSGDGSRSCASCHRPAKGFSDGEILSAAFGFKGKLQRNTPTVVNAALQNGSFYDRRVTFLEDQATAVVTSSVEMHGSLDRSVAILRASEEYMRLFRRAFPGSGETPVTERNIRVATSIYLRSLVGLDAPFDRYLRGENDRIAPGAIRGFNLFMGKARCGTCHFAPLYNGTVPPTFAESEIEILGVTESWPSASPRIDPDQGRYLTSRIGLERFAFKTPTVRNIALTAPYMHNGAFGTLEEVVEFYDQGGALGLGLDLPNQTLAPDRLNLTTQEKQDLVEFMNALTDTVGMTAHPARLPSLGNGESTSRMVGGSY